MRAQTIRIRDHADLVFLFDATFRDDVLAADRPFFSGDTPFDERAFLTLFELRMLVVYDLQGAESGLIRVVEGDVPAELEPERAGLILPTGRLRVETPSTLRPGAVDPSGTAIVRPAEYLVALHRVDWAANGCLETVVLMQASTAGDQLPHGRFISGRPLDYSLHSGAA